MSFTTDANILLYAVNTDCNCHEAARAFVERLAEEEQQWALPWPVVHAFLRIATHPGILPRPLSPAQAVSTMQSILDLPHVRTIGEDSDGFWGDYAEELRSRHHRGNAVPDALIVAIMRAHGVSKIYTRDRDFLKFSGIKAVDPLA